MDINSPIPREWEDYVTQTGVGLEVIPAMLYDTEPFVGGVTRELELFKTNVGKNLAQTNMKQNGLLANPESFLIQNIRVYFHNHPQSDDSGVADSADLVSQFSDLVTLVSRGILQLLIGEKQYGPWPLWTLPAHNFVKGGFSTGSDLLADYGQVDGMLYELVPNLMIAPLQPFQVTLSWPGLPVIALSQDAGEVGETLPIEVLFDGKKARAIQ